MGGKLGKQQSYVVSGGKRERVGEGRRESVRSDKGEGRSGEGRREVEERRGSGRREEEERSEERDSQGGSRRSSGGESAGKGLPQLPGHLPSLLSSLSLI